MKAEQNFDVVLFIMWYKCDHFSENHTLGFYEQTQGGYLNVYSIQYKHHRKVLLIMKAVLISLTCGAGYSNVQGCLRFESQKSAVKS